MGETGKLRLAHATRAEKSCDVFTRMSDSPTLLTELLIRGTDREAPGPTMAKQWIIRPPSTECEELSKRWRVPAIVAQLLINRGLGPDESSDTFLSPQLRDLIPPARLPGATQAAKAIACAARERKRIVLYGDYDVDGTTGIAILWHTLKAAGLDVATYVPHRVEEGYGLNRAAVERLVTDGAQMIVSVDCGITAHDVAALLSERGVPLVVVDHHTMHGGPPAGCAVVHPGLDESYPNQHTCGAAAAFKLAWAIAQEFSGAERVLPHFRELLKQLLPLAALGTVADVVPLTHENRIIVRHGLTGLRETSIAGLRALIDSAGLSDSKISAYDVGFRLAPRINAAGRMGHARLAVELLTRADGARSREIAIYLEEQNRSRQATERQILKAACELVDRNKFASDARRALVVAADGWHAGVIGIVAARLVERYHRPAVMIALSNGSGQGSARSIAPFDLAAAFTRCSDHLISHGGHAMAAGLKVATNKVDEFREAFIEVANNGLTGDDLVPKLRLDGEVALSELTLPTAEMVANLGPFGSGNPRPLLATDWVELAAEPRAVGSKESHLQASFRQNGSMIRGIGFGLAEHLEDLKQHRRCRAAFEPIINEFNGRRSVEMHIVDIEFPRA